MVVAGGATVVVSEVVVGAGGGVSEVGTKTLVEVLDGTGTKEDSIEVGDGSPGSVVAVGPHVEMNVSVQRLVLAQWNVVGAVRV